jgi:hypothetical protein
MSRFFFPLTLAALAGCTNDPGFAGVSGVREADASEVAKCAYITDIRARPGVYGPLAEQGLRYARNSIMADAKAAGANTVVFDKAAPGSDVYQLHLVAYRC